MIAETDLAYIAGLFDGEGSIHFKRGIEKKKKHKGEGYRLSNSMRISMEITMTDHSVLIWLHEVLGVGTLRPKTVKVNVKMELNTLKQYKWRCTFKRCVSSVFINLAFCTYKAAKDSTDYRALLYTKDEW